MSLGKSSALWAAVLACAFFRTGEACAQDAQIETVRHPKTTVQPAYPELARRMNLRGSVKVALVVAPNGTVKDAKVVGGHPVLATAALEAVRKWRFEPAAVESTGVVDFKFEPHQ